jgi:hypothetical protein
MSSYRWFYLGLIFNFFCAVFLCILIDTYGFYRIYEKVGFNQQKEGVRGAIRYVKAIEVSLRKPELLLMGSSRVHDGINPSLVPYKDTNLVYNYGIDMLRINEATRYLKHAIINSKIKKVVFGLDFFMFNSIEKFNPAFDSSLVGRKINFIDLIKPSLPSKYGLNDAYRTIKISNIQKLRREFLSNGYRPGSSVFYKLINYRKLHYYTNWIFLSDDKSETPYYANYEIDEQTFECFENYLKICKSYNIECVLFITPAHALLDGEGIYLSGLWYKMEYFKRRITSIASKFDVVLWDFSGYNYVTTEKIQTPMKYYWDSSHFKEIVGNLIIDQLFGKPNINKMYFGKVLTEQNIEKHLNQNRIDRINYIENNENDVKWLQELYATIKRGDSYPKEFELGIFSK